MKRLIERFGKAVKGVLTGFDRIVFKGSILPLSFADGAMDFLRGRGVLNKNYKPWMTTQTARLVEALDRHVRKHCGQGITHLNSWRADKDELARERQKALGDKAGLIGAWSFLESGRSYRAYYCAESGYPQLRHYQTPCKHVYLYFDHKDYGFMNVRIQTWFPYPIQVCMNGRQWLRRSLQKQKIGFLLEGNKFLHVADFDRAGRLLDKQMDARWPELLDGFLPVVFPNMRDNVGPHLGYYWTLWQSEWATDLVLNSASDLNPTMEALLRHAVMTGTSTRVLRYMGRPLTVAGKPYASSNNEVFSRVLDFYEGIRLRHWVDRNSMKIYNEHNVLRAEVTINTPGMFHVYRRAQGQNRSAPKKHRPLRKGVADIPLRAQVSQEINDRFLDGVAAFSDQTPMRDLLNEPTHRMVQSGRRVRGLDPTGKDRLFLEAIADPAFSVSGITNAALRERLHSTTWGANRTEVQLSARVSRHLRLLRDHGFLRKVPHRRRYHLTPKGTLFVTALNAMLAASTQRLMEIAA